MLIGRHSSLSGASRRQMARVAAGERIWTRVLRAAAYGLLGLLGLAVVLTIGVVLLARRPPPARLAGAAAPRPPAAAPEPDRAALPADPNGAGSDSLLRAMQTRVESETAVLAALRDQADEARREVADLEQQRVQAQAALDLLEAQKQAAQGALSRLGQQQEQAKAGLADLQRQVEATRTAPPPPARIAPPPRREADAVQPVPAHPAPDRPIPDRPTPDRAGAAANADLARALGRLRQAGPDRVEPKRVEPAPPQLRSPPPSMLGQVPAYWADSSPGPAPARPRVFLNYRAGSGIGQQEAMDLAQHLLFSDFAYAETRMVPASTVAPVIRYFHREDADSARRLADLLRGAGVDFQLQDASGAGGRAGAGTIEVWIPS